MRKMSSCIPGKLSWAEKVFTGAGNTDTFLIVLFIINIFCMQTSQWHNLLIVFRLQPAGPASRVPSSGRALAGRGDDLRAEQTGGTGRAAKTMWSRDPVSAGGSQRSVLPCVCYPLKVIFSQGRFVWSCALSNTVDSLKQMQIAVNISRETPCS